MTRAFSFASVLFAAISIVPAAAQTGVPMPSPTDVINMRKSDGRSPCGNHTRENPVEHEIEAAYQRAQRCNTYAANDWNDYSVWVRGLDRHDEPYGYEVTVGGRYVIGDYETVANYFNYHGITWWDGQYTPGYRETARLAGQTPPGLTTRYTGTGSSFSAGTIAASSENGGVRRLSEAEIAAVMAKAEAAGRAAGELRPAASDFADGGAPGACGIPYLDQNGKEDQAFFAEEGDCAEYVAEIEEEGY